ncbi:MAG: uroporphyrinogen-III C-methyltransferase [Marinicellaceae bacterium]
MSDKQQESDIKVEELETIDAPEKDQAIVDNSKVIIKKGSFLSFIAFLLAASSLTVSAYLYMQMQKNAELSKPNDLSWQEPVAEVEKNTNQKFNQLSTKINQIQKTNIELQQQLKSIENIATNLNTNDSNATVNDYDDSKLLEQIEELKTVLSSQSIVLDQVKNTVKNNNSKNNKAIQELSQKMSKNSETPSNQSIRVTRSYAYELAEHFLKMAYQNFSIYENGEKGQEFLSKTIEQLSILEGEGYASISKSLEETYQDLISNPLIDVSKVSKVIDQLKDQSSQLSFKTDNTTLSNVGDTTEDSSWFDKLIVIRKVNDENVQQISSTEKEKVFLEINNHFSLLKVALMKKNQTMWEQEIDNLTSTISNNFNNQSTDILSKLTELKSIKVNPVYPNLLNNLTSIQSLNSSGFDQADIPFESKLKTTPSNNIEEK